VKQSLNRNTLAFHLGVRPGVRFIDRSMVPLSQVSSNLNKYMKGDSFCSLVGYAGGYKPFAKVEGVFGVPEVDALIFYTLSHALGIIRQKVHPYENLGEYLPIVEEFHWNLSYRAARMFYYLLLICTRESRHEKSPKSSLIWKGLRAKYGDVLVGFQDSIKGTGSLHAADAIRNFPPQASLGDYTKFLSDLFDEGAFCGGYGGPAWGAIAHVLRDFSIGKLTAEMMLDTAFTLAHNNGTIFNKGMLFKDAHKTQMLTILDVQRSGQIPQMICNEETVHHSDQSVQSVWANCSSVLGDSMRGYVDWFMVEELGAVGSYSYQKDKQVASQGYPSKFKAKVELEKIKKAMKKTKEISEALEWVQITPTLKVKKGGR